jgi:hypothetical protein
MEVIDARNRSNPSNPRLVEASYVRSIYPRLTGGRRLSDAGKGVQRWKVIFLRFAVSACIFS